jgi:hypothetical protein
MLFDRKRKTPDGGKQADAKHEGEPVPDLDRRVKRRRNRIAGMWAAELLGLIGQAAHDYAREVAHAHESTPDDERVIRRLASDLHGKVTIHEIRDKLAHLIHEARRQLLHEDKDKGGG